MRFPPLVPCLVIGVLFLVLTNVFVLLPAPRIYDWDEARHGITAYEMIKRGDFLTNTYMGEMDYWNTKPPLSFYPLIAGYKFFGFNNLGLRFFLRRVRNAAVLPNACLHGPCTGNRQRDACGPHACYRKKFYLPA